MGLRLALVGAAAAVLTATASGARLDAPQALVGGDYYDTSCTGNYNLLKSGAVDPTVELQQLEAMHVSGLNSLRLTINYTSDSSLLNGGHGGAILIGPDGAMIEPYRTRFIRYLRDAKAAGFADVTIAFYPYGPNSPQPWTTGENINDWNPSLYAADWGFVQDVHDLTKQYGPAETHFDLMAEGPASGYDRNNVGGSQIDDYITRLYKDYVVKYGNSDVFFTAIGYEHERLVHEIENLKASGEPMPLWWGFDIQYTGDGAASDLAAADATLTAYGLSGSLALGETAYEDGPVSSAVQQYNATAAHKVVQVEEYPNLGTPRCVDAPFTGYAYLAVLGIQPGPLLGRVDARGRSTLTTSDGMPVRALKSGTYTVLVTDASKTSGFRISTYETTRSTSASFRGTVTWTIDVLTNPFTFSSVAGRKVRRPAVEIF